MAKIFAIIISIFSISAFATMDCASGHRFESYSLGTTQIFGLDIEKPLINDDYCWRLGELAAEISTIITKTKVALTVVKKATSM